MYYAAYNIEKLTPCGGRR